MSSQFLQTELTSLIQESRRKNADLRAAAEQSLNELKALPSTSEAQISADLIRKPKFVDPFIIACHTRQAKLAGAGVICLQRLIASHSLPPHRLGDVLAGLKETIALGLDIQLKILQSLPSLLQFYSQELSGDLLARALDICANLQACRTPAVSSTAAATFQQLVVSIFERVSQEDQSPNDDKAFANVKVDGRSVQVARFAFDALKVLEDLCCLVDGEDVQFLSAKTLSTTFTLELIENIVLNSGRLFVGHLELSHVLRVRLMPLAVRFLSERHSFSETVRVARILLLLLKRHMSLLVAECEMAFGLLTHLLEPDGNAPWKRVLCMEVFKSLYSEPGVTRIMYTLYDADEKRKNILGDHMASLVRLSSEKPSLIGVSNQSTIPLRAEQTHSMTEDQIALETGGVAGVIGSTGPTSETKVPGISSQWSVVRTPYIDLLDKADPPLPPETYIYGLVLNCISSFAEGLAKFILPLTVPDVKSKKKNRIISPDQGPGSARPSQELQSPGGTRAHASLPFKKSSVPMNPLELHSHVQYSAIKTCSGIIENCWPAVLAACSTFLHASLDDDFYHNLVRAFQKLAHVAGLLRLSVPRDAFLTTLGKAAIPAGTGVAKSQNLTTPTLGVPHADEKMSKYRKSSDVPRSNVSAGDSASSPAAAASMTLSTRNLLCLRALLNLGIALGPTLDQPAWTILLETLQCAELVIGMSSSTMIKSANGASDNSFFGNDVPTANLGAEVIAVQSASAKMFESTSDYPSNSFQEILLALLNVSAFTERKATPEELTEELKSPIAPQNSQQAGRMHHNNRRVSLIVGKSRMQDEELKFVLDKGNEIARANLERLSSLDKENLEAWQLFSESLTAASANQSIDTSLRLQACNNLNSLIFLTMKPARLGDDETWNRIQTRNLQTLKEHIARLYVSDEVHAKSVPVTVIEIHEQSLDTLHAILEQYAETLTDGWSLVFDLISGVFGVTSEAESVTQGSSSERRHPAHPGGPRLVRAAYKSLHLIASDFVSLLPAPCLLALVQSLNDFASQTQDFNISLTTTTFFWNVSDFLRGRMDKFSVGAYVDASVREDDLEALSCSEDLSVSSHCLWLLLLLRIVDIASDSRSEIRNSAVHTLLRIFDAYGQQLSSKAWRLCLNRVLFSMVGNLSDVLEKVRKKQGPENELKPWIETTVLVIKGVSSLVANFLNVIVSDEDFLQSWKRLFDFLQKLVDMRLLELSEATFASVSSILTQCNSSGELSKEACHCVWTLWANGHPMREENPVDQNRSNQDAALAYMQTLQQLYHLHKSHLDAEHIDTILEHLRLLVWNSIYPPYSPDTERCSAVQALVIGCLRTLCMEKENSQAAILSCLADLSDSPLSKWNPSSDSRKPGFVAFSKTLIDLISWYIAEFGIKQDILSNDALALILERFGALILQKYIWKGKDRDPYMWQKASTATLKVLEVAVPYVEKQYDSAKRADIARFWRCVVNIAHGMVSAHGYQTQQLPHSRIAADEEFDIAAFTRLKCLILPSLGAAIVPDTVRQSFALALFHSSFIYAPQRLDMPLTSIEQDPLRDFYTIRPGRTFDPPPTLRPQMAYVLIDSLFELAATSGSDTPTFSQRTLMACSTAPYLLLRCAISLKSFIADQPLRGLMPQPTPARKELLHLLDSLEHLHSEPSAIPDSTCIKTFSSKEESASGRHYRKHLEWMFPLVVKAVRVAGKERDDGRVLQALSVVLQELGHFE